MSVRSPTTDKKSTCALPFHSAVQQWFAAAFPAPTAVQSQSWPLIADHQHTLLLAPTGSGKTLAAFLVAIDRIMFPETGADKTRADEASADEASADATRLTAASNATGVRVLYISPLKALGVDVERNLRAPLAGITAVAQREGYAFHPPTVGVRSGDTPAAERHRMMRHPPEILITTPESLFLMLTSRAREFLASVDTVIIDEIHSMVASKRGAHLFLSLERLEQLRRSYAPNAEPMQRIGLSATQRPLEEVARLLGGAEPNKNPDEMLRPRPVEIVQAGRRKAMELTIEVPVADMSKPADDFPSGSAAGPTPIPSIWPSIHPRLVALIKAHRSTMIFVNSRRLAERLAAAINEVAEEEIALAHHGSIARDTRLLIEDRLKRGDLPAIVATSSLELGIDMGAVDLAIQIEAPPSIASGIQRIGRAGHQVDAASRGVIFPKYRGDLLACSAAVSRMLAGEVEATFYPRNPLDVLAQQIVAMVALESRNTDELFETIRAAAPFAELTYNLFESVLDLLSGRYPSDEFSELRPRLNWDRVTNTVSPRRGTQRLAVANAGTIPDRGLYGVFLAGDDERRSSRVGELDEEMVFECKPGDVFLLGASSWRVLEITHDRVLVEPAPGEPGRMPFWHGDGPGRPLEFGQAIGALTRELLAMPREAARQRLIEQHALDDRAAHNLLNYLHEQVDATTHAPSDKTIVIESFLDEIGDWRVVVMTPFGSRVHAPWATAVAARLRSDAAGEVDMMWSDDGIVFRLPGSDRPPDLDLFFPAAAEVEDIVVRELGGTALFAARFRENAARALLLPRRSPGKRTPLWLQRRRSADLLRVASRYERFPIMLETYRECLRDVFDLRGLKDVLQQVSQRSIHVHSAQTNIASPFAASLLFNYTANFLYNGDAPLAERRAATLALDHVQLRELLGDAQLRELLDADVVDEISFELQHRDQRFALRDADAVVDLLRYVGDLSAGELAAWPSEIPIRETLEELIAGRRVIALRVAGQPRYIAAEDAARYRDALGCVPPQGIPNAFLEPVDDALADLVSRYARTHVPFQAEDVAARLGLGIAPVHAALVRLQDQERLLEGEFLPRGRGSEWCDVDVLRRIKRRSLARLRKQVEPVEPAQYAGFLCEWQGLNQPRHGLDGLLDVLEQLQGMSLPASEWERAIFPARIQNYEPGMIDELCAAGEVLWRGFGTIASHDGRVAFYLTDSAHLLAPTPQPIDDPLEQQVYDFLAAEGASFFHAIAGALGLFRNDLLQALWRLVWAGHVSNDTIAPLRSLLQTTAAPKSTARRRRGAFRSRRALREPGCEGRWSVWHPPGGNATDTERQTALATQLIERYGVLTREAVASEGVNGGFAGLYPVLKAMEETGRVRRGYFVDGQGAAQFASPGADDRLRGKFASDDRQRLVIAATDPANAYGAALRWPVDEQRKSRPQRKSGTHVILVDGALRGYLNRSADKLTTFLPDDLAVQEQAVAELVEALIQWGRTRPLCLKEVDEQPVEKSMLSPALLSAGFVAYGSGYQRKANRPR